MSYHTLAPWRLKRDYDNSPMEEIVGRHTVKGSNGYNIARIWESPGAHYPAEEVLANARLIAAAPYLLAAVTVAIDTIERWNAGENVQFEELFRQLCAAAGEATR
uniref:Uncharacterized protein n=1 Tax=viral metagenome TaxID=1070528 RepID=A0A6H1ZAZ1_9ZZZZ